MRNHEIAKKLAELKKWAADSGLLKPDEELVCSAFIAPVERLSAKEWVMVLGCLYGEQREQMVRLKQRHNRPQTAKQLGPKEKFWFGSINISLKNSEIPLRLREIKEAGSKEPTRYQLRRIL